jgi:hypothetical protein
VFRFAKDAELTKALYRRVPILVKEKGGEPSDPWKFRELLMFMTNTASHIFRTKKQLEADSWILEGATFSRDEETSLPLYEAKMFHQFDHRWGTYEGQTQAQANQAKLPELTPEDHGDPARVAIPRYWVPEGEVLDRLKDRWDRAWLVAWRYICRNTDSRTTIAAVLPRAGVADKAPLALPVSTPDLTAGFYANLNSFVLDYVARQKVGGTSLTLFVMEQFAILPPSVYHRCSSWSPSESVLAWLLPRIVELSYTAWDVQPFAADCGFDGPPFRWDEDRRFQLRCELDAAFFHFYLGTGEWKQAAGEPDADFARLKEAFRTPRHAVEYVMNTFPIVRQQDEQAHGCYRTKERILAVYDAMTVAHASGSCYRSPLDPPPADPRCRHADRGGTLAPGAVRTIADLLTALPPGTFPLRLTEADIGPGQARDWTCKPLTDGEPLPPEGTWVLLRSEALRRGPTPLSIAAGRLALNPIADGMEVLLKGAIPPATLRLTAEQWKTFRPLAVLTPLALPE